MNEGLGQEFYRKGNSVKRSGTVSELPDSSPPPKSALMMEEEHNPEFLQIGVLL